MTETSDHRPMWVDLGLDEHDALLGVLGQAYGDVFMAPGSCPRRAEERKEQHEQ